MRDRDRLELVDRSAGAADVTVVTLPWPSMPLWPNRKAHWSVVARHRQKAKDAAWALTRVHRLSGPCRLTVAFHPPRKPGLMNVDNAIAAMKAQVDGIALALGVDDSRLVIAWPETFAEPLSGGDVRVEIERIAG